MALIGKEVKTMREAQAWFMERPLVKEAEIVGNHIWTIQSHSNGSFITCFKLSKSPQGLRYEGCSEAGGIDQYDCPEHFLDKVPQKNYLWRCKVLGVEPVKRRNRSVSA